MNHQELPARIAAAAHEAGAAAMQVYATDFEVRGKADRSPVTEADDRAEAVLAAAGGRVTTLAGADLRYGKPGLDNPHFVARGLSDV